jgi:uncharacterized protein (TIGR03083 family)
MDNGSVTAYRDASRFLVEAVRAVPDSGWDAPGLGDWNVRELVGHANRGHTTVADYLVRPQQPEPPGSTYFSDEAIAARGREAVRALGADPASAVAAASTAVVELIEQSPPDAKIGSPAGTMTLAQFLPSRTAELTIHALDIVRAIGADLSAPPTALRESLVYVAQRAARKSGQDVLLALSGRAPLPAGYSVY